MKKLSLLVALALLITVSGVYAAWSYTSNSMSGVDRTLSHGMTTATTDGDVGVFKIESNTVDIAIDQTAIGNYDANLIVTGEVKVRFTPNSGAPTDVVNNAVDAKASIYIKNADVNLYEGTEIYVSSGTTYALDWEKQTDGSFLATISAENIKTLFSLGKTFNLPTHADYLAFHALEENITITLAVHPA